MDRTPRMFPACVRVLRERGRGSHCLAVPGCGRTVQGPAPSGGKRRACAGAAGGSRARQPGGDLTRCLPEVGRPASARLSRRPPALSRLRAAKDGRVPAGAGPATPGRPQVSARGRPRRRLSARLSRRPPALSRLRPSAGRLRWRSDRRLRSSSREPSRCSSCWGIISVCLVFINHPCPKMIFLLSFFLGPLCPVHTVLWHGLAAAAAAANLLSPAAGNGTARSASRDDGSDFWRRRQAGFWGGRSCPGVGLPRPRAARKWWSLAPAACRRPGLTLDVRMCICAHGCACACVCTRSEDATVFSSLAQHDSSSPRGRRGRRACLEPASASHAAGYKSADNRSELCPCSMRAH